jgi:hypothetical protein
MSKIDVDQFKWAWYNDVPVNPDDIEDEVLRSKYVAAIAAGLDYDEAYEAVEEYIRGRGSGVLEAGDAYVGTQSNQRGPRLPH